MIRIPLEAVEIDAEGVHLLIRVRLLGHDANVVLDTGASRTVFDRETIAELSAEALMEEVENRSAGLGTTSMQSFKVLLPELTIGNTLVIENYEAAVLDLSSIKTTYEALHIPPVIGVLGGDILRNHNALISYKEMNVTFDAGHMPDH